MKLSTSFLHIMLCMFVLAYPADNIYHRWADGVLTPSIGGFYRPRSEGYVSQVCVTHSVQLGGMTPDASWDKSHGHGGRSTTSSCQGQRSTTSPRIHMGTTVNGRVVRILLECILVTSAFAFAKQL